MTQSDIKNVVSLLVSQFNVSENKAYELVGRAAAGEFIKKPKKNAK